MRLFEVEDSFARDLEMVLRNQMGRSNAKHSTLKLTYPALSNIMKNLGYGAVDFEGFKKVYDSNPSLQGIIRDFNDTEVIVSTDAEKGPQDGEVVQPNAGGDSVDSMASQAANQFLNSPLS